ncbi:MULTISPECIES: stage III sporulation protein AE [Bacillaceae]|uniref:Stage III sporulation protein AE n=1 Tax=Evansella alkalicola TaxID=745819 RepID=A0ABS6K2I5_9BACI|nr:MULTISPECIES: stage III sporulation protein AE [Bacillaceae]MBU9724170.1 stage III sporulation protein AE [Bacillus alkalicola]
MKKFYIIFIFFISFLLLPQTVLGEGTVAPQDELVESQLERLGLEEIGQFWEDVLHQYGGYLPESQRGSFMEFIRGEKEFSPSEWLLGFLQFLFHEIFANGRLLGSLVILAVLSMVLAQLQQAFEKHNISKIAYAITFMVLLIIALNSFHVAVEYTQQTIEVMSSFMIALVPLLLVLMATTGSVTSVALFHPIIMFLVHTSGVFVQYVVLPLLLLSTLLFIVSTMTDHYKVTKLATFIRNIAVGSLGIFLTVFLGVLSVQGATAAVADGIAVKTAKFVTGNFIPVVGRMFTDAADTVMGASLLVKNTVGVVGLVILLLVCIFPALKVLSIAIIYSFTAAILQPLGGGPIIQCLSIMGKSMLFIFGALAAVSLMFFLAITIIIISGNLSLMMR